MFCPNCGQLNEYENKFCQSCGMLISERQVQPIHKSKKRYILIPIIFLLIAALGATYWFLLGGKIKTANYGLSKKLSREKAQSVLNEIFEKSPIIKGSFLNPILQKKPEFASFKDLKLFDINVVVTGVIKKSEHEAAVEYKLVNKVSGKQKALLKEWISSMNKLEKRLESLQGKKYKGWKYFNMHRWSHTAWEWVDPSDEQLFACDAEVSNTIKGTPEWKKLQSIKIFIEKLLEKEQVEGEVKDCLFVLYDDGWRLKTK